MTLYSKAYSNEFYSLLIAEKPLPRRVLRVERFNVGGEGCSSHGQETGTGAPVPRDALNTKTLEFAPSA